MHALCRCGYQFCYQCGIEWKKNQRTCPSAGCLQTRHGNYDDDDQEYDSEEDTGDYSSDEEGRRWSSYEEYIDQQMANPRVMFALLFNSFGSYFLIPHCIVIFD